MDGYLTTFAQISHMKVMLRILVLVMAPLAASAAPAKGLDGHSIAGLLMALTLPIALYFFIRWLKNRGKTPSGKIKSAQKRKYTIALEKNKLYYPDYLLLKVTNSGNCDVDLDRPLLTFSNIWLKRNFRIKGTNLYHFYPVLLEPGKTHEFTIDLAPFYRYDRRLIRFPRVTVSVREVGSRRAVSQSVMLRKTLLR
jgi:hypothetical protein